MNSLAERNAESLKLNRENITVANDLKMLGLAKLLVGSTLMILFKDRTDSIRISEIPNREIFEGLEKDNQFISLVKDEFRILGFDGGFKKVDGYETNVYAKSIK